jgi:5-methylcytosine-specific restriction endonuclease McrA
MSLPRSCAYEGCPRTVVGAPRCPEHTIPASARSGTRARKLAHRMKIEQPWCSYCGSPATKGNDLTIDHIVPLSRGGTNRRENLTVACSRCNRAKSDGVAAVDAITRTASEKSNDDIAIG